MRRIIERVVTVVTTTTWKISWEQDANPSQPAAEAAADEFPDLEVFPESLAPAPTVTEIKEVDPPETKNVLDPSAEGLRSATKFNASKKQTQEL